MQTLYEEQFCVGEAVSAALNSCGLSKDLVVAGATKAFKSCRKIPLHSGDKLRVGKDVFQSWNYSEKDEKVEMLVMLEQNTKSLEKLGEDVFI